MELGRRSLIFTFVLLLVRPPRQLAAAIQMSPGRENSAKSANDVDNVPAIEQDYRRAREEKHPNDMTPRFFDVVVQPLKHEPNLGDYWNITCRAQVIHEILNKSILHLTWISSDGRTPMFEAEDANELKIIETEGSIVAETYLRISRVLPAHSGQYQCRAKYLDKEINARYELRINYDSVGEFTCTPGKKECPEFMECDGDRKCVCDASHPVLIRNTNNSHLCYPAVELGYSCQASVQCEKATTNSECLRNVCQCSKSYIMRVESSPDTGTTKLTCVKADDLSSSDKSSAYRGVMIASTCFGVVILLVIAAFPIRKTCTGKCPRGDYIMESGNEEGESRRGLRNNVVVNRSSQTCEKPPSYEEVLRSDMFEDAPPSYESLGILFSNPQETPRPGIMSNFSGFICPSYFLVLSQQQQQQQQAPSTEDGSDCNKCFTIPTEHSPSLLNPRTSAAST